MPLIDGRILLACGLGIILFFDKELREDLDRLVKRASRRFQKRIQSALGISNNNNNNNNNNPIIQQQHELIKGDSSNTSIISSTSSSSTTDKKDIKSVNTESNYNEKKEVKSDSSDVDSILELSKSFYTNYSNDDVDEDDNTDPLKFELTFETTRTGSNVIIGVTDSISMTEEEYDDHDFLNSVESSFFPNSESEDGIIIEPETKEQLDQQQCNNNNDDGNYSSDISISTMDDMDGEGVDTTSNPHHDDNSDGVSLQDVESITDGNVSDGIGGSISSSWSFGDDLQS